MNVATNSPQANQGASFGFQATPKSSLANAKPSKFRVSGTHMPHTIGVYHIGLAESTKSTQLDGIILLLLS